MSRSRPAASAPAASGSAPPRRGGFLRGVLLWGGFRPLRGGFLPGKVRGGFPRGRFLPGEALPGGFRSVAFRAAGLRRFAGAWHEVGAFAASGAAAYAADLGLFVWLRGPCGFGPLTAKALSFVAGCTVAYLGNALVTYRGRTPAVGRARQYGVFVAVNLAGALVQLLCLGFSHYVLDLATPRDDVVSGLGVGMLLATALRFWGTRNFVFRAAPPGPDASPGPDAAPRGLARTRGGKRAPAGGG